MVSRHNPLEWDNSIGLLFFFFYHSLKCCIESQNEFTRFRFMAILWVHAEGDSKVTIINVWLILCWLLITTYCLSFIMHACNRMHVYIRNIHHKDTSHFRILNTQSRIPPRSIYLQNLYTFFPQQLRHNPVIKMQTAVLKGARAEI